MYFVVCVPDPKQNPPQSSAWQVQSLDASYGNKELNHESDVQQQQHPQHMSITAHMALCMTAAPKSRRQIKAPARRKTDICHRDETEPTIRKLSLSFTHEIDQRMDSISYVSNVLCLAVFSHYLPLALHRDFFFFYPAVSSHQRFGRQTRNRQRESDSSVVLPSFDRCVHEWNGGKLDERVEVSLDRLLLFSHPD